MSFQRPCFIQSFEMANLRIAALLWVGLLLVSVVQVEPSQPLEVDEPSQIVESFHIKSDIRFRFATTMMTSVVRNRAADAQEIPFKVTLPKEAFIVNFSMAIDGKEYIGEVKEKGAAKRQYVAAVEKGESAGLIRQAPRHSNVFDVAVNVAHGSAVTFTLTYQELLRRKHGIYEHEIHVKPGQAVEDFSIEIFIQENRDIPFVKTPALRENVLLTNDVEEENELTIIERPTPKTARILYAPTLKEQGDGGVSARFVLQYDIDHADKGEVLVVDGYFLHFYGPNVSPLPKDIIFVLDVSGSMNGRKIDQLQTSMVTILKDLSPEDRINILTFSDSVRKWKTGLTLAASDIVKEATDFVKGMRADGGTNINEALQTALSELKGREMTSRVGMIFFLTDGQPTSGVTNINQITTNVRNSNEYSASIFGLAFGSGADFNFLKTMCGQNSGFARKIYEASDSALQVASLYDEISTVVMKNVTVKYLPGIKNTTETKFPVVFNGTEIVICGRFDRPLNDFVAKISGIEKSGEVDVILDIDDLNEVTISTDDSLNTFFTMPRDYVGIVEKMWAFLTIKQLLKEKERVVQDEEKAEQIKKKILAMSLKYKFVTPLTSMVVTKPGDEDKNEEVESGLEEADSKPRSSHSRSYTRKSSQRKSRKRGRRPHHPISATKTWTAVSKYPGLGGASSLHKRYQGFLPDFSSFDEPDIYQDFDLNNLLGIGTSTSTVGPPRTKQTTAGIRNHIRHKKDKNGKKKSRKLKSVLSTISVKSPKLSACLAPRRIVDGTYSLLEGRGQNDQLKIEMSIDCFKKCRLLSPKSVNFTYNGDEAGINLSSVGAWRYSQGQNLTVRMIGQNQLKISTQAADVVITRTQVKRKVLYDIEVVVKTREKFKGLLGQVMRVASAKKRRSRKRRNPKGCQNKKTDVSLNLKKKFANRFKITSVP